MAPISDEWLEQNSNGTFSGWIVPSLIRDLIAERQKVKQLKNHIENGMDVVTGSAGFISGVIDNIGGDSSNDPRVIACLRWVIETQRLLGLPLDIVDANDDSPWARAMRAALDPSTESSHSSLIQSVINENRDILKALAPFDGSVEK